MSNASPTALMIWAMLACLFLVYLLYHLWAYDKFRCLSWNSGRQPGAFKRVMTYSYLLTIPMLVVFSVGTTYLKYQEGYILVPIHAGGNSTFGGNSTAPGNETLHLNPLIPAAVKLGSPFPKPVFLWTPFHQTLLLAMYFVFSAGWALEQVTHFEELAFWLFLLDQKTEKRDWFQSWEYRLWYLSSIGAIVGMPLTTFLKRNDLDATDAWTFLVGASTSTFTNLCFIYVLFRFPSFLRHVKEEGANPDVVVRLSLFYELNFIRVIFRFAVSVPLLILAIDGIQGPHRINKDLFVTDCLLMIAGLGEFLSSAMTLMIFFPRSVAKDAGYQHKSQGSFNDSQNMSIYSASYYPTRGSYYPPGVQSPTKSPAYPPAAIAATPLTSPTHPQMQQNPPPFLFRGTRRSRGSEPTTGGALSTITGSGTAPSRVSLSSTSDGSASNDGDDEPGSNRRGYRDGDAAPSYYDAEPGSVEYPSRPARVPRRRSSGTGKPVVDFDVPEDVDEEGISLPRLTRRGSAPGRISRYGSRRRASDGPSSLHPYVENFTSPIDLVDSEQRPKLARWV